MAKAEASVEELEGRNQRSALFSQCSWLSAPPVPRIGAAT